MIGIFVGLGSNLGDRERNIRRALAQIDKLPETAIRRVSSLYDTDPVSAVPQPDYLNAVAEVESTLGARELLWQLLLVEARLGRRRQRHERWGARVIDLDLLLFGTELHDDPDLVVPHPELHKRAFVLIPLSELAPDLVHPVEQRTVRELLHDHGDFESVRYLGRFWYLDVK